MMEMKPVKNEAQKQEGASPEEIEDTRYRYPCTSFSKDREL